MVTVGTVVRRLSRESLQGYLVAKHITLPGVDWAQKKGSVTKPVLVAIEGLDPDTRARVVNDTERVGALADEPGQVAIFGVVPDPAPLDALANGYERSLWLFLNEPALFQRAEEARYTDDRRRGKQWDGFIVEVEGDLRRDTVALDAFVKAIRARFGSRNVHVEIFDRSRRGFDGSTYRLVQATVYSEGHPEDYLEFVEGTLDVRGRRPVIEACITYEPDAGVVETVASDRDTREAYARLFSKEILNVDFDEDGGCPFEDTISLRSSRSTSFGPTPLTGSNRFGSTAFG